MKRVIVAMLAALTPGVAAAGDLRALEAEFKATCQKMVAAKLKGTGEDVIGKEGWVVLTTELNYAASGPFWGESGRKANPKAAPEAADPLPAILDFDRQLKARGITLIFMPVPTRIVVYPEAILGKEALASFKQPPHLHTPEREFMQLLRRNGVKVVELTPLFLEARQHHRGPLFIPSESHWTAAGIALATAELAKLITPMPFYKKVPKYEFTVTWQEREHFGHIYKDIRDKAGLPERPKDRLWIRSCKQKTPAGEKKLEWRNPESPVVIIGDSNIIWWRDQDSSLFHQLSADLGFPVDNLATTGGGATNTRLNFIRTAFAEKDYLAGKKVVIWCFTSRSFFNSHDGWKLIPLEPPAPGDASS
ncbi:MAG TPA: hypothetical protein P5234_14755 [Thermoanaerobaculaceae bacterium]|mgnify:CR=1 FL=1|nr:hypothetical protein [Thermoanaerobaculaceae bacterium]HRS17493.1 hypothetical protein [Thermoanaerobaculaceae bacterium]